VTRGTTSVDPSRAASGRPGGRRFAARWRGVETVLLTAGATDPTVEGIPPAATSVLLATVPAVAATPAVRTLERAEAAFTLHPYDPEHPSDQGHGEAAVVALGADPRRVLKTLVARVDGALTVAVVPVATTLDLKALAAAAGGRKAAMADPADAERATGYVLGGISPLGQKKALPTVVDESALGFPTVMVSAGRRGLQVELAPGDLVRLTKARTAPIGR
jgi:Cys-tRNA(Pro)/Cys-tRNA(Cys) deacylase